MVNIMIVFVVSGLWHGAAYTFLIWGAFHGLCMIIERQIYGKKMKEINDRLTIPNIIRILITFCIVSFAWIFFRAESFNDAMYIIKSIMTNHGKVFLDINTLLMAFIAFIIVFMYDFTHEYGVKLKLLDSNYRIIRFATATLLICYIIGFGVLNSGSFIYFQF